jgi:hypothetical protein
MANKIEIPHFSAECILFGNRKEYRNRRVISTPSNDKDIVPQACHSRTGHCTGGHGTSSVSFAGYTETCNAAFQYPWIQFCDNGDVHSGCGFCVWCPTHGGGGEYVPDPSSMLS